MQIKIKPNKIYLYHHINPENNEVFYVGVGKHSRVLETSKSKRSKEWLQQFNKTGLILRIIKEFDNREEAYKAEILEIKKLTDSGVSLINKNEGGLGQKGIKPWNAGKVNPFSKETVKKLSKAGKKRYSSREIRVKHSKACGGKMFCAKTKNADIVYYLGNSQNECAELLGLRQGCISKCLNGQAKSHKGYVFEYVDGQEK